MLHEDITEKVIAGFYEVYNTLGYGFLEKYYEKAMLTELEALGLRAETQVQKQVFYKGLYLGDHYLDLVVEGKVVVEIKAVEQLIAVHEAQLLNYLRVTGFNVGLLLNFGKKPEIKRKVVGIPMFDPCNPSHPCNT